MDYFIDSDKYYPNIKTKMWKNNDFKTVMAKMATISTVVCVGAQGCIYTNLCFCLRY